MLRKVRIPFTALLCCAPLLLATSVQAGETVRIIRASLSPDKLGAPSNAFGDATAAVSPKTR
jgi:hypothetical protein